MTRPSLSELTSFVAVATHRNFRKAAESLGVSRSSLSHTMRALEEHVGVELLRRTTRSVAVTDAGEHLLGKLQPMLEDLDATLSEIEHFGSGTRGTLRITAPIESARELMVTVIPEYRRLHPEVSLEVSSEGQLVDIVARRFDAGVRLREAVPNDMIAVPFGEDVRFLPVASPEYIATHGTPRTPDDLEGHVCIRNRLPSGKIYRWEFEYRGRERVVDPPDTMTFDDSELMVQAARAGLGIAFVAEAVVRTALQSGELVSMLEDWCPSIPGMCLYFPKHRQARPALRAFVETLRKHAPSSARNGDTHSRLKTTRRRKRPA